MNNKNTIVLFVMTLMLVLTVLYLLELSGIDKIELRSVLR